MIHSKKEHTRFLWVWTKSQHIVDEQTPYHPYKNIPTQSNPDRTIQPPICKSYTHSSLTHHSPKRYCSNTHRCHSHNIRTYSSGSMKRHLHFLRTVSVDLRFFLVVNRCVTLYCTTILLWRSDSVQEWIKIFMTLSHKYVNKRK